MPLATAGLGGPSGALLTFGLGIAAGAAMPTSVPTSDAELLEMIRERGALTGVFAATRSYNRRPLSRHTSADRPTLLVYPDNWRDAEEPNPAWSLRILQFAAVVVVADQSDEFAGPTASDLAETFRTAFGSDRSFGGRCVARFTYLSEATHSDEGHPEYAVMMMGQAVYERRRGA